MSILMFVIFGLVAGLLARALVPGRQSMGLLPTTLLGMAGSFIGGLVASLTHESVLDLHTTSIIGGVIGAVAVLLLVGVLGRRGSTRSYV